VLFRWPLAGFFERYVVRRSFYFRGVIVICNYHLFRRAWLSLPSRCHACFGPAFSFPRLAFLLATLSCCPVIADMRAPIPSPERQKEIAPILESTYGLTTLDGSSKKQAAIKQLMEASTDEQMSDEERYVVLKTVISLTTEIGDVAMW
jgi:hypothetical protein